MKKINLLILGCLLVLSVLSGCASNQVVSTEEINYKEMTAADYWNLASQYYPNERNYRLYPDSTTGYKLTNTWIKGARKENRGETDEIIFILSGSKNGEPIEVLATEFCKNMKQSCPGWTTRVDEVSDNPDFNGKYTVYLKGKKTGNFITGYETEIIISDAEGIPTEEQIELSKANAKRAQEEKEAAEAKAKAEQNEKVNKIGKAIAEGYVYHGIEEDSQNAALFRDGALESGHAYYISLFMVGTGGATGAAVSSIWENPTYNIVQYINQKVKGQVGSASHSIFGNLPVTVIVAGGSGISHTPVILGMIGE